MITKDEFILSKIRNLTGHWSEPGLNFISQEEFAIYNSRIGEIMEEMVKLQLDGTFMTSVQFWLVLLGGAIIGTGLICLAQLVLKLGHKSCLVQKEETGKLSKDPCWRSCKHPSSPRAISTMKDHGSLCDQENGQKLHTVVHNLGEGDRAEHTDDQLKVLLDKVQECLRNVKKLQEENAREHERERTREWQQVQSSAEVHNTCSVTSISQI